MLSKLLHIAARQRKADSVSMTSIAREQLVAGLKRVQQMEGTHRTDRTMRFLAIARDDEGWTPVSLHDSCSSNTDHAAMPRLAVYHDAVSLPQPRFVFKALQNTLHDAPLFFLALGIENVQALGDFSRAAHIFNTV